MDDAERRARLGLRHALAPGCAGTDPLQVTRSLLCLHATDPASVYLSVRARQPGFTNGDLDHQMMDQRDLVKTMAMRRTLFVFDRDLLPAAVAGPGQRVAATERRSLLATLAKAGLTGHDEGWLATAEHAVVTALRNSDTGPLTATQLRELLPELAGTYQNAPGKSYGGTAQVAPRVITILSASGQIVRGPNDGPWYTSRPRYAAMTDWLGGELPNLDSAAANAALVRAWLHRFGPGTEQDLKWWLGSTLTVVRQALTDVEAHRVQLADGTPAFLLPDDVDPTPAPDPWTALLPALDPTVMGWSGRDWYLGPHRQALFDSTGNAGPTMWCDGRVVGGWCQDDDARVQLQYLEDPGPAARAALRSQAEDLTEWLAGRRVMIRFPNPLSRSGAGFDVGGP